MLEIFTLTLSNVGLLLIYVAAGYFMRRKHALPDQAGLVLSLLCTLLFSPAYTINNLSQNLSPDVLAEKLLLLGYGVIFAVAVVFFGRFLAKKLGRTDMEFRTFCYAFAFSNYGYFGYPVIEGVFGSAVLADFIIFLVPMGMAGVSYGYMIFQKEPKFRLTRLLKSPLVLSVFIGTAIGLMGIPLPAIIRNALSGAGRCMSPASMLLAGFMLGKFPLKKLLTDVRPYVLSGIRMLAIPLLFGVTLFLLGLRGQYLFLPLAFSCLPLGLNLVVYPESMGFEKEAADNAKLCFISYLLSLGILPCIFTLLTRICE